MSQEHNRPATLGISDTTSDERIQNALIQSILARKFHSLPVRIEAVKTEGGVSKIGYVDILPLAQQADGDANAMSHAVVYNVPYMRIQGGANAVILDPEVGDIGIALFCDRDISKLKASGAEALPGSGRRNSLADAVYLSSIIAGAPTQYVRFSADGIEVVSPTKVTIQAPDVAIVGGSLTHNDVNIGSTHVHDDPQGGATDGPH